jgi:hypothetical protein
VRGWVKVGFWGGGLEFKDWLDWVDGVEGGFGGWKIRLRISVRWGAWVKVLVAFTRFSGREV